MRRCLITNVAAAALLLWLSLCPPSTPAYAGAMPDAYLDIVEDFEVLHAFLAETDPQGVYFISRAGATREEASRHLRQGFNTDMVDAILAAYTFTDSSGQLYIIPCEALPFLYVDDWPSVTMTTKGHTLSFSKTFYDCYRPGDSYIYEVTASWQDASWKIEAISLADAADI